MVLLEIQVLGTMLEVIHTTCLGYFYPIFLALFSILYQHENATDFLLLVPVGSGDSEDPYVVQQGPGIGEIPNEG